MAREFLQTGGRLAVVRRDQHHRAIDIRARKSEVFFQHRAGRQRRYDVCLAAAHLAQHPLYRWGRLHIEDQPGTLTDGIEHPRADATKVTLIITIRDGHQLFVDQYRNLRMATHPAAFGGGQLDLGAHGYDHAFDTPAAQYRAALQRVDHL